LAKEVGLRFALTQDEIAAGRSPECPARFMGGVRGLDNLGREREILTGKDPDFYMSIIACWGA